MIFGLPLSAAEPRKRSEPMLEILSGQLCSCALVPDTSEGLDLDETQSKHT